MDVFFAFACLLFVLGLWLFDRKTINNRKDINDIKIWCDKLETKLIASEVKIKRLRNAVKSLAKKEYIMTAEKKEDVSSPQFGGIERGIFSVHHGDDKPIDGGNEAEFMEAYPEVES